MFYTPTVQLARSEPPGSEPIHACFTFDPLCTIVRVFELAAWQAAASSDGVLSGSACFYRVRVLWFCCCYMYVVLVWQVAGLSGMCIWALLCPCDGCALSWHGVFGPLGCFRSVCLKCNNTLASPSVSDGVGRLAFGLFTMHWMQSLTTVSRYS